MHTPTALLIFGSGLLASAGGSRQYAPASLGLKRDTQSCEQTYGAGFVACGSAGANGTMCFNPSQGQKCCATDNGFCDKGLYCAPVAGYCCEDGEDVASCAKNNGFALPASLAVPASAVPSVTLSAVTTVVPVTTWTESLPMTAASASTAAAAPTAAQPKASNTTTTAGPPQVPVSDARKEQWTLVYMTLGIGMVALIMASF